MGGAVQPLSSVESIGFEVASRSIPPALSPYVRSWAGYIERTAGPLRRRELPGPQIVVIFEFGPPLRVFDAGSETKSGKYPGGFVAGLADASSMTEHGGFQAGMEVKLSPFGARALFGVPLSEMSRAVLPLADLLAREHRSVADRLASAPSWDARFDIIESLLLNRVRAADFQVTPAIWAARKIEAAEGAIEIGALCRELGYSHKHVLSLFRQDVGLSPKLYARLTRFDATVRKLRAAGIPALDRTWAELAFEHGYADQSHLVRELKHFSGLTPSELRWLIEDYPL
jgi:AraC-like DNA-binding protein